MEQEVYSSSNACHKYLKRKEAADILRIHPHSLDGLIHNGSIPFFRIGRRIMIDSVDLEKYINSLKSR